MENLQTMTNKELVAIHNTLAEQCGVNDLGTWKKSKNLLIEKIEQLREQVDAVANLSEALDEDDSVEAIAEATDGEFEEALQAMQTQELICNLPAASDPGLADNLEEDRKEHDKAKGSNVAEDDGTKRTIKAASVELLCHVSHYEDRDAKPGTTEVEADHPRARSVGLAYDEIIRRLQEEFPGCNTSVACLRWYAVKIRVEEHGYEGLRLPQRRPRAKPKGVK